MSKLKAFFITAYVIAAVVIAAVSIGRIATETAVMTDFGSLLTVLPVLVFLLFTTLTRRTTRTPRFLPGISVTVTLGTLIALAGNFYFNDTSTSAVTMAITGHIGYLLYLFWYSEFGHRKTLVSVGAPLPEFEAKDLNDCKVKSSDMIGKPVLWVFYRGNWCSFCMAQLRELEAHGQELLRVGAEVVLISSQPVARTRHLAKKYTAPFRFWIDDNNRVASDLNLNYPLTAPLGTRLFGYGAETALPTVVITDAQGRVVYVDETVNYRIRPQPGELTKVIEQL